MPEKPFGLIEKSRAEKAWGNVKALGSRGEEYRSVVRGFPAMVHSAGIGQALAFLFAKKKGIPEQTLLKQLCAWLAGSQSIPWAPVNGRERPEEAPERFLDFFLQQEAPVWWAAENEAIEYSLWLKRFAEALYTPQDDGGRRERPAKDAAAAASL